MKVKVESINGGPAGTVTMRPEGGVLVLEGAALTAPTCLNINHIYAVNQGDSVTTVFIKLFEIAKKGAPLNVVKYRFDCSSLLDATQLRDGVIHAAFPDGPRNLHIFVNPASGSGRAVKIWQEETLPILTDSIHNVISTITTHRGHAEEVVRNMKLGPKDTLVSISGDGLLFEIVNGAVNRPDFNPRGSDGVTFATIPGGSGNGLAMTLHGYVNARDAAIALCLGRTVKLDCMITRQPSTTGIRCGFLGVGYAISADIDINSEFMRPFFGGTRFIAYALKKLLQWNIPGYGATLRYVPAASLQHPPRLNECTLQPGCPLCGEAADAEAGLQDWHTVTDDLLFVNVNNIPYIASDCKASPYAHLSDGLCDLVFVRRRDITRMGMVRLLLALETGGHVMHPAVQYVKCHRVELMPQGPVQTYITLDGEVLKQGEKIEIEIMRGALCFVSSRTYTVLL